MDFSVEPNGDRLDVTGTDGRRYTFPIVELRAARRRPRASGTASDLPVSAPLRALEAARRAAEDFAIRNDLI